MELIEYMRLRNKMTKKEWEDSFEKKEKEIIVLRHEGGGGSLRNGFWDWALPAKKHFLVVEVLEKNAACKELEEILAEYRKPIVLQDDVLGELTYDKQIKSFEGNIAWLGGKIHISLYVDKDNKSGITKAKKALKILVSEQKKWDADLRSFAAKKLTKLACEWAESEEEAAEITEESFAKRISLSLIWMTSGGSFSAYFDDDDLFFGHSITVCGSPKKGIISADIEG